MKTSDQFRSILQQGSILIADGATGTNLQKRGLPQGSPSDIWVLDNPEEVLNLHRDFIAAGAEIILTDTFGAKEIQLKKFGLGEKARELNLRAVELAQKAAEGKEIWIGGSIGPIGELLEPYGSLKVEEAEAQYSAQASVLLSAGVDLLVVETQYDLNEAQAAIRSIRILSKDIPLVCSFSYDRGTRTMMGVRSAQMAEGLLPFDVDMLGINCGRSPEENLKNLRELRQASPLPIWFKPNAGLPEVNEKGGTSFHVSAEDLGGQVKDWVEAGAKVVGGCCGTTPAHIAAIARSMSAQKRN